VLYFQQTSKSNAPPCKRTSGVPEVVGGHQNKRTEQQLYFCMHVMARRWDQMADLVSVPLIEDEDSFRVTKCTLCSTALQIMHGHGHGHGHWRRRARRPGPGHSSLSPIHSLLSLPFVTLLPLPGKQVPTFEGVCRPSVTDYCVPTYSYLLIVSYV
jgi:hypothetical protein